MDPKKPTTYVPAPEVPPEMEARYRAMLEVLSGRLTVTEAAKQAGLSRHRFQTLMHRGMQEMLGAIAPHPAGRPAKPEREASLEHENEELREENARLAERLESMDRLLGVASQFLRGAGRGRKSKTAKTPSDDADEGLRRARELRALGLDACLSAAAIGRSISTVRRWAARHRAGRPLCERRGPGPKAPPSGEQVVATETRVRQMQGCIGAEALRHAVPGISRRDAAAIKSRTLIHMEKERREAAVRVMVKAPGIVRGFDAMEARTTDGKRHLLVAGDACVAYRTALHLAESYDTEAVLALLEKDFAENGVPLVVRADRAAVHRTERVRELLDHHGILLLHGPPRHPRYYGQQERQNREHREWLEAVGTLTPDALRTETKRMVAGLNELKPRSTLSWKTPAELWRERQEVRLDRQALRDEVAELVAHLKRKEEARGWAAGFAERLAIERALIEKGFLGLERGGWCYRNSTQFTEH